MEVLAGESILRQRGLGAGDVDRQVAGRLGFQAAQQHVRQGDGVGLQFLAEGDQHGRGLALGGVAVDVVHGVSKEAAGAAGRIVESANQARIVAE